MAFYWVNQGLTYQHERAADLLWAPIRTKNTGLTPEHWRLMSDLAPGDIVFNYTKGKLVGYCRVVTDAVEETRPYTSGFPYDENQGGRLVVVEYVTAETPTTRQELLADPAIKTGLMNSMAPRLLAADGTEFNQIYLTKMLDPVLAVRLFDALSLPHSGGSGSPAAPPAGSTTTTRISDARLGQGKFRIDVSNRWSGRCCLTGLAVGELLIASHIKPWKVSNNAERLDPANGLFLAAGVDKAFDQYLLTIDTNGDLVTKLSDDNLSCIGINRVNGALPKLQLLDASLVNYLSHHRAHYKP